MIIVLRPNASEHDLDQIVAQVTALGLTPHVSRGVSRTIIGCIGDEDRLREVPVLAFPAVETILPVEKPYKLRRAPSRCGAAPSSRARLPTRFAVSGPRRSTCWRRCGRPPAFRS